MVVCSLDKGNDAICLLSCSVVALAVVVVSLMVDNLGTVGWLAGSSVAE